MPERLKLPDMTSHRAIMVSYSRHQTSTLGSMFWYTVDFSVEFYGGGGGGG